MKTLRSIEHAVLKTLGSVETRSTGDLSINMLELAAARYREKYGYVPEVWSRMLASISRFRVILVENGYTLEEVESMSVLGLRDAVSDLELVDRARENRGGTVTKWKEPLKKAA